MGASNAVAPVIDAICLSVAVSGGTSSVWLWPNWSWTVTDPFGVPSAIV